MLPRATAAATSRFSVGRPPPFPTTPTPTPTTSVIASALPFDPNMHNMTRYNASGSRSPHVRDSDVYRPLDNSLAAQADDDNYDDEVDVSPREGGKKKRKSKSKRSSGRGRVQGDSNEGHAEYYADSVFLIPSPLTRTRLGPAIVGAATADAAASSGPSLQEQPRSDRTATVTASSSGSGSKATKTRSERTERKEEKKAEARHHDATLKEEEQKDSSKSERRLKRQQRRAARDSRSAGPVLPSRDHDDDDSNVVVVVTTTTGGSSKSKHSDKGNSYSVGFEQTNGFGAAAAAGTSVGVVDPLGPLGSAFLSGPAATSSTSQQQKQQPQQQGQYHHNSGSSGGYGGAVGGVIPSGMAQTTPSPTAAVPADVSSPFISRLRDHHNNRNGNSSCRARQLPTSGATASGVAYSDSSSSSSDGGNSNSSSSRRHQEDRNRTTTGMSARDRKRDDGRARATAEPPAYYSPPSTPPPPSSLRQNSNDTANGGGGGGGVRSAAPAMALSSPSPSAAAAAVSPFSSRFSSPSQQPLLRREAEEAMLLSLMRRSRSASGGGDSRTPRGLMDTSEYSAVSVDVFSGQTQLSIRRGPDRKKKEKEKRKGAVVTKSGGEGLEESRPGAPPRPSSSSVSAATQAGNPIVTAEHIATSSADKAKKQQHDAERTKTSANEGLSSTIKRNGRSQPNNKRKNTKNRKRGPSPSSLSSSSVADGHDDHNSLSATTAAELTALLRRKDRTMGKLQLRADAAAADLQQERQLRLRLRDDGERLSRRVAELTAAAEGTQAAEIARLRKVTDGSVLGTDSNNGNGGGADGAVGGDVNNSNDNAIKTAPAVVPFEQAQAEWLVQRDALVQKNRILAAQLVALQEDRSDSLRALAARAVGDLDALHSGARCSVEAYLDSLDGGGGGVVVRPPPLPERDLDNHHHNNSSNHNSHHHRQHHGDGGNSHGSQPLPSTSTAAVSKGNTTTAPTGIALLLLTYDAALGLVDCCLTVDESQARLLSSGPAGPHGTGRRWSLLHRDSEAELSLAMGVASVRPVPAWEQQPQPQPSWWSPGRTNSHNSSSSSNEQTSTAAAAAATATSLLMGGDGDGYRGDWADANGGSRSSSRGRSWERWDNNIITGAAPVGAINNHSNNDGWMSTTVSPVRRRQGATRLVGQQRGGGQVTGKQRWRY